MTRGQSTSWTWGRICSLAIVVLASATACSSASDHTKTVTKLPITGVSTSAAPRSTVALPPPLAVARAKDQTFFEGNGSALLAMHREAAAMKRGIAPPQCRATVVRLDRTLTGEQAAELIAGTNDAVLRAALDDERRALGVFLTSCVKEVQTGPALERIRVELTTSADIVDQRLKTLGIAA